MAATILNVPGLGWTDASGNPLSGGKIYIYQAGTIDTVKASYPTRDDAAAQSNANTHPVVLDSAGRPAADIWVDGRHKAVVTDAADLVIATVDDLGGTDSDDLIPRDYVGGLAVTVSGGDSDHDFVVAAGEARDDADSDDMVLVSSLTKQVDVVWAAGSNAGALDTGTVAAGTDYYIYLIKSSGTGAVDVLLSASASAPTMPSGYDKKQLIARLVTDASANISAVYGRDEAIAGTAFSKATLSGLLSANVASIDGLQSINGHGQWGFRNLVINGAMQVAQRGTAAIPGVGGNGRYYTVGNPDMFSTLSAGDSQARFTGSVETSGGPSGFSNWFKLNVTTAESAVDADDEQAIVHVLEAQNLQHLLYGNAGAKTVALQFRLRSPKTGTHCVALYQPDGERSYVREFTVAAVDTWETHVVTFPGDVSGTVNNDNGGGLQVIWPIVAGSNFQATANQWVAGRDYATANQQNVADAVSNVVGLTGVQLEVGSIATAFQHVPFGVELARCQRYYWRGLNPGTISRTIAEGTTYANNALAVVVQFPVTMRAAPVASLSNNNHFMFTTSVNSQTLISYSAETSSDQVAFLLSSSATPFTANGGARLRTDLTNGASAYVEASAEL